MCIETKLNFSLANFSFNENRKIQNKDELIITVHNFISTWIGANINLQLEK